MAESGRIPPEWKTGNIKVNDVFEADIGKIEGLYKEANAYLCKLGGENGLNPSITMRGGVLPAGVARESYRIQAIRLDTEIIGYLEYYEGFPAKDILFIAFLYIHPDYQKNGLGQQVVGRLSELAKALAYKRVRINVYLKNWPALRFWTKMGFNRIWKVYGDKVYSESTFASMEMDKEL